MGDPLRPWDTLAALWAAMPLMAGPTAIYRIMFETARHGLVGRRFTSASGPPTSG